MATRLSEANGKHAKHMLAAEEHIKKYPHRIYKEYEDYFEKIRNEATKMR